jgi:hypothetical protein
MGQAFRRFGWTGVTGLGLAMLGLLLLVGVAERRTVS